MAAQWNVLAAGLRLENKSVVGGDKRMSLADVASRFAEADLERLPVVDDQRRLLGTVSKRDVLKHGKF